MPNNCRVFHERYPHLLPIDLKKFRKLETLLLTTSKVKSRKNCSKPPSENEENEIVLEHFEAHRRCSVPAAPEDFSKSSIHRILKCNKMHPFSEIPV